MASSFRDPTAKPGAYNGIQMRSGLEVAVAHELDALGVQWAYEAPAPINGYLPDFTIISSLVALRLPRWVEVKPAQLLYDARDRFGLREDLGGERQSVAATPETLRARHIPELDKPQRLAQNTGKSVLVVSALNRHRTLSITCHGSSLTFSKWHPAVNWKAVLRQQELERQQAEAAQRRKALEQEWEARRARHDAELRRLVREYRPVMAARYSSACTGCGQTKDADAIRLYRPGDAWIPVCASCIDSYKGAGR